MHENIRYRYFTTINILIKVLILRKILTFIFRIYEIYTFTLFYNKVLLKQSIPVIL